MDGVVQSHENSPVVLCYLKQGRRPLLSIYTLCTLTYTGDTTIHFLFRNLFGWGNGLVRWVSWVTKLVSEHNNNSGNSGPDLSEASGEN